MYLEIDAVILKFTSVYTIFKIVLFYFNKKKIAKIAKFK